MYDYSKQILQFHDAKVRMPKAMSDRLVAHRKANEDRLIARLPKKIDGLRISKSRFRSQGSFAMRTIIQTRLPEEEYDIDEGLLLHRSDLTDKAGADMDANDVAGFVREALKDERFVKQPLRKTNCIRVYYAEEDNERHHVDFPVYRTSKNAEGDEVKELASKSGWIKSDPTQVNVWFESLIKEREAATKGAGTQIRQLVRLLKRFCKSRKTWDMPNGMKLTMLVAECSSYDKRIDKAFESLLASLDARLAKSLVIENLADPALPRALLTKTNADPNLISLRDRITEARNKLEPIHDQNCTITAARIAWDWVFKTDGFLESLDDDNEESDEDERANSDIRTPGIASAAPTAAVTHLGDGRFG